MKPVYIGVDIGTTTTKSAAFDAAGREIAVQEAGYELLTPQPERAEQEPAAIFDAVITTLKGVISKTHETGGTVKGIGFSSAMHSLIAVDEKGKPLTRVITWADRRSVSEADALKIDGGQAIYRRTGTPIHPMSPLTKLMWFKKNEKELFAEAHKWISIKEYIFYQLFREYVVDYSIASATGLFNLENLDWDPEALEIAGVGPEKLSRPVSTLHQMTDLRDRWQERLGLPAAVPFIVGATDGVLANLGVGAIGEGEVACTIGTSGAIRTVVDEPVTDPKGRLFCYALTENKWVIGGPINNGGIAFQWLRDNIFSDVKNGGRNPYEVLTSLAAETAPGADGLLFIPSLTGERAPYWNADTKAVFFGLTLSHDRAHMVRSVLEGVIFQMYAVVLALKDMGVEPSAYRATGGFTRSELWLQMMADIFECPIEVPETPQSACYGAAILVQHSEGEKTLLTGGGAPVRMATSHTPEDQAVKNYRKLFPLFLRLSREWQDDFRELAEIQRSLLS